MQSQMKNAIGLHFTFQCFPDFLHVRFLEIGALSQGVSGVLIQKHAIHDLFYARKLISQIYLVSEGLLDNFVPQ